jgi:hypothetical protein
MLGFFVLMSQRPRQSLDSSCRFPSTANFYPFQLISKIDHKIAFFSICRKGSQLLDSLMQSNPWRCSEKWATTPCRVCSKLPQWLHFITILNENRYAMHCLPCGQYQVANTAALMFIAAHSMMRCEKWISRATPFVPTQLLGPILHIIHAESFLMSGIELMMSPGQVPIPRHRPRGAWGGSGKKTDQPDQLVRFWDFGPIQNKH